MPETERRLAAIMFTDIVGYTALMGESEAAGMRVRERHRALLGPLAEKHHGRIADENGDELVLVFPSALDAVSCALAVQRELAEDAELKLRIGIHSGDVVFEGDRIYGDGVNIASRIRPLAEAGGIRVSGPVYDSIKNHPEIACTALGPKQLKNVDRPVSVFAVSALGQPRALRKPAVRRAPGRSAALRWALPAAALALLALLGWWLARASSVAGEIRSLAVLPLENLSGDPEQEYFADGMTEALIGDLAKIGSLKVISRTSVMQYKGARKALREIANELDVDAIVEGSVLRSGGRVRISAQLIDARSDHHLWAEHYERALEDVLTLQGEVATAIAREIRVKLTPEEKSRLETAEPVDPKAHDLYLRGRFFWSQRSPEGLRQAIRYFERAVEADPRYARAWAGLADAHLVLPFYEGTDPRRNQAQVRSAAERALEIDDSLAEAHAALALQLGMFDWNFERGEELFRHANELDPNQPVVHQWYGDLLSGLGRFEEAIAELERARELDPLYTAGLDDLGLAYATAGRHAEGVRTLREAIELDPEFPLARMHLGLCYLAMGEVSSAAAELERAVTSSGGQPAYSLLLAVAVARMGRNDEARALLADVLAQSEESYVPPLPVALVHRALGDEEEAFRGFERAFEVRDIWTLMIPIAYDPELRADPRFRELVRRHGLPESFTALPASP